MFEGWLGGWKIVREGSAGLLYRDGVFRRVLGPGRYRVGARETLTMMVTARQMTVVSGQEVPSSDGFQPKLTAVALFTVADPVAASRSGTPFIELLHLEVQLALRALASTRTAEALAQAPRAELDAALTAAVQPGAAALGVAVEAVRVRDVVLPADLRRLLTGVEKARREGQAALERAHSEQAALRSLANAARMLRNNPELQNLRLLQAIGGGGAVTVVLGTPAGMVPLQQGPTETA